MTLGLPDDIDQQGGDLFKRNDVRETEAGGITQTNFNTNDFLVTSGVVNLKNKSKTWSDSGAAFQPQDNSDVYSINSHGNMLINGNMIAYCPVNLPNGVVVTLAAVSGIGSEETWELKRSAFDGNSSSVMASAGFNEPDSSISNAIIDNDNFSYFFITSTLDSSDEIYQAVINYNTDYD